MRGAKVMEWIHFSFENGSVRSLNPPPFTSSPFTIKLTTIDYKK